MGINLAEYVTASAARHPHGAALVRHDRTMTWGELERLVRAFAGGVRARGLARGDRVVMVMDNTPEFAVAYFGTLRAGCVAVPLHPASTEFEVNPVLALADPHLLLVDPGTPLALGGVGELRPPAVIVGSEEWRTLLVGSTPPPEFPGGGDDLAAILFTSGTSGRPKGAMLTHRALAANIEHLAGLTDPAVTTASDVVLTAVPLCHSLGLNAVLGLVARTAATVLLPDPGDPVDALAMASVHRATVVVAPPTLYQAWSRLPQARESLASARLLISGTAPLGDQLFDEFVAAAGLHVWEGYGMTEAGPVIASGLAGGRASRGTVGVPLPGVELMLRDEDGHPVDDGDPGEIVIRSEGLFSGYWPDGSDGPDSDGWWATSDVGIIDADGNLRLVDRRAERIVVNGFSVYPREVEGVIMSLDGVREVAVMGVPDAITGQAVKAVVVGSADMASGEVIAHARARLARFKCPTVVEFVPELPHSGTGKVSKGALRDREIGGDVGAEPSADGVPEPPVDGDDGSEES